MLRNLINKSPDIKPLSNELRSEFLPKKSLEQWQVIEQIHSDFQVIAAISPVLKNSHALLTPLVAPSRAAFRSSPLTESLEQAKHLAPCLANYPSPKIFLWLYTGDGLYMNVTSAVTWCCYNVFFFILQNCVNLDSDIRIFHKSDDTHCTLARFLAQVEFSAGLISG